MEFRRVKVRRLEADSLRRDPERISFLDALGGWLRARNEMLMIATLDCEHFCHRLSTEPIDARQGINWLSQSFLPCLPGGM